MGYFNVLSYVLSRVAFLATHLVFAYWLNFILNDPFNLGTNTLDSKVVLPADKCTPYDKEAIVRDVLLFAAWWLQHSVMARKKFKVALGLWQHPLERPLFATFAWIMWFVSMHFWQPITNCSRWDPLTVSLRTWSFSGAVIAFGSLLVVGLLWSLPDHVFGTGKYKYPQGKFPASHDIIRRFPYGLVRHPAATGFLWMYWALPAYTPNHLLLAGLWTVFIVIGTLVFEEGGLRGDDEFGKKYDAYAKEVSGLYPNISSIQALLGFGGKPMPAKRRTSSPKSPRRTSKSSS